MSFGYDVHDVVGLIQLSWSSVEGATRACGKYNNLTKEVWSLYEVLARVYAELSVSDSSVGHSRTSAKAELQDYLAGCEKQLRIINAVLDKFNTLDLEQRVGRQLWSKVRFSNGEDQDVAEIQASIAAYATVITMLLHLMSLGPRGKFERQLGHQKGSLQGIRSSVNFALARINSRTQQKSLILAYTKDSKAFWSRLRRELTKDGFSRSALNSKKDLIISYMKELDSRGILGYSTCFRRIMKERQEVQRQSITPASLRSSPSLTKGRSSNSSFQSFNRKDSGYCSAASDGSISTRSGFSNRPLPHSRPVTAEEHDNHHDIALDSAAYEPNMDSLSQPIPYRERAQLDSMIEPKVSRVLSIDSSNSQPVPQNSSYHGCPQGMSRDNSRHKGDQKVKLEDPNGREFSFPLSLAKSWEGMKAIIRKNCAGIGSGVVDADQDRGNLLASLWEDMAEPGAKLTIRRPTVHLSQPAVFHPRSEEFCFQPERPVCAQQDDFSHLPTLGDWMRSGITEFTPHSEFYEVE